MKPYFGTEHEVILHTCAGTGALEAAVVNTLSRRPRAGGVDGGVRRPVREGRRGLRCRGDRLVVSGARRGRGGVRDAAAAFPGLRAVLLTHNETSTGVTSDIPALADACGRSRGRPAPVDAISALGAVPFAMDAWGLDLVVTGSQKAWMSAPGMAMAAVGPRAWAAGETARMPRFYLDLTRHRDTAVNGETPWTPAVAILYQVDEGLRLMQAEVRVFEPTPHRRDDRAGCVPWLPVLRRTSRFNAFSAAWIQTADWKAFNGHSGDAPDRRRGQGRQGRCSVSHLGSVTRTNPGGDRQLGGRRHRAGMRSCRCGGRRRAGGVDRDDLRRRFGGVWDLVSSRGREPRAAAGRHVDDGWACRGVRSGDPAEDDGLVVRSSEGRCRLIAAAPAHVIGGRAWAWTTSISRRHAGPATRWFKAQPATRSPPRSKAAGSGLARRSAAAERVMRGGVEAIAVHRRGAGGRRWASGLGKIGQAIAQRGGHGDDRPGPTLRTGTWRPNWASSW